MGRPARKVLQFQPRQTPSFSYASHMPCSAQRKLSNMTDRFDLMMRDRPIDAAQFLEEVDLLMRHVYGA